MKILSLLCLCCLGLAAEDQVQFQPGVLAKVYACGAFSGKLWWQEYKDTSNLWPIDKLPDSPGEILRLKELPIVDATPLPQLAKDGIPSYLVNPKTGILRGVNFYAVEFEGYFSAPIEGVYTLVITSDDPIEVFIEGKSVCKSDYAADPIYGPTLTGQDRGGNPNGSVVAVDQGADPRLKAYSATIQASLRLAPNKFYHSLIVCRQRWLPVSEIEYNGAYHTSNLNRGAVFRATLTTPDGKSGPLPLQLPVVAKAAP